MEENLSTRIDQAWEYVDSGELEAAFQAGKLLIDEGEEAGYRILARAYAADEQPKKAISILQEGISRIPGEWRLWLLLGTFLSDADEQEAAKEAFESALQCPDVVEAWVHLNQGVLQIRMGEVEEGLNTLQQISETEVVTEALNIQFNILDQLARHDLILEMAEEELETLPEPTDEKEASTLSRINSYIATACWYEERPEAEMMHYLRQAIAYERPNPDALWLLREAHPNFSDQARFFRLMVKGEFKPDENSDPEKLAFVTAYEIVADNEEEALEFIRDFEVEEVDSASLEIVEAEAEPAEADEAKGIYAVADFDSGMEEE